MNNTDSYAMVIKTAILAGKEILKIYNSDNFDVKQKSDNSPITKADKKSHELINKNLSQFNIPILSEEGVHLEYEERKKWKKYWLIDPLDGTTEFIKKNGEFTVNIALIDNRVPIFGIIYAPVLDILYFGETNIGAYKIKNININNEILNYNSINQFIEISDKLPYITDRKIYTIVGSRSFLDAETKKNIENIKQKKGEIDFITRGSSLKFCMIAEGKADLYPRYSSIMEWDTGAGHAIVTASGGSMKQIDGTDFIYNNKSLYTSSFICKS